MIHLIQMSWSPLTTTWQVALVWWMVKYQVIIDCLFPFLHYDCLILNLEGSNGGVEIAKRKLLIQRDWPARGQE